MKIVLSFVVGGTWVALSTVTAERLGSKRGGFIGGLPSTAVVALLFVGLIRDPRAAADATTLMPFVQGISGVFLLVYMVLAHRGLAYSMFGALGVWLLLTGALVASGIRAFTISVAAWIFLTIGCYLVAERRMTIPSQEESPMIATTVQILCRALFGGWVIALAVFVSKLSGPVIGGIFATFPAMFITTLIVVHRKGGAAFSRAVAKSLLFSGMINIPVYAIVVRHSYPWAGLAGGTAMAFTVTCGVGYVLFRLLIARAS